MCTPRRSISFPAFCRVRFVSWLFAVSICSPLSEDSSRNNVICHLFPSRSRYWFRIRRKQKVSWESWDDWWGIECDGTFMRLGKYLSTWKSAFQCSHLARGINLKNFFLFSAALRSSAWPSGMKIRNRYTIVRDITKLHIHAKGKKKLSQSSEFFVIVSRLSRNFFCTVCVSTEIMSARIRKAKARPLCVSYVTECRWLSRKKSHCNFPQIALIKSLIRASSPVAILCLTIIECGMNTTCTNCP